MKKITLICALFVTQVTFNQINELKKAQEKRKEYIQPEKTVSQKINTSAPTNFTQFVNPFIGTGGHGHTYPGAAAPFGMVQLSPDTRYDGWDGCSGYHYSDSIIYGFSFTHLSGTGVSDLCDILVVPQQGKPKTIPGYASKNGYGAKFKHADEHATPGKYSVKLIDPNIDVTLVATERSGIQQFIFNNPTGKKYILIDIDHRDEVLDAFIESPNKQVVSGFRKSKSWATNQQIYFYMELSVPYVKKQIITKDNQHKLVLEFPESTTLIQLRTGISAVDVRGAQQNVNQEIPTFNLNKAYQQTQRKWNDELGKINFKSPEAEVMINFYTALYHAYLCPTLFTDVDERYLGNDGKIYNAEGKDQYSVFSLWDTYRAAHPLYTITQPKRTQDFITSFLRIYQQTNDLPVWELVGNETDCMIGYHSVSVILDAYRKGIRNFDANLALQAMIATATHNELGKRHYASNGFLGTNIEAESVSKTLEYAYDDWCIAEFAKEIGNEQVYKEYLNRSFHFLNVFDPTTKFMRARRGGQWFTPFQPAEVNFNYTEANSWQYSLAAPQHIPTLRYILGGKDSLQTWLDRLFTTESKLEGRHQVDITGLIGQYAHGNEPSHHMAYLYNYTNQPYKTQEKVDQILREMYHNAPDGLSGNEDCGQMSAWYALSALGFYPVCPGTPYYAFGRPMQETATIQIANGNTFTIRTHNNSSENKYIDSIRLDGQLYDKLYIDQKTLIRGGELEFFMSNRPNLALNQLKREISEEAILPIEIVPVPYFTESRRTFTDTITTEIKLIRAGIQDSSIDFAEYFITYTTDGSEPTYNSMVYTEPLHFSETTILKAQSFVKYNLKEAAKKSDIIEGVVFDGTIYIQSSQKQAVSTIFLKSSNSISLQLETFYANQYAAGGENALIDGIRSSSTDFRSGDWQGFEGVDAKGKIYFDTPKNVSKITVSCLQDERSWIFFPTEIQVFISNDGINFSPVGKVKNTISPNKKGNLTHEFEILTEGKAPIKAIQFVAVNRMTCPEGHISAGEKSWIFLDEVIVE